MEIVPVIQGLNLYNPSDEHLLLVAKARVIKWEGRGGGICQYKVGISGPISEKGIGVVYGIKLMGLECKTFPDGKEFVNITNNYTPGANIVEFERGLKLESNSDNDD